MKALLLTLFAALLVTAQAVERKPQVPESMTLTMGGPQGPSYRVELVERSLKYTKSIGDNGMVETINPTAEAWADFQQVLEGIRGWEWKKSYDRPEIKDGDHWTVKIAHRGRTIDSEGHNAFPPDFEKYLAAVKALLGGREFR